MARMRLQFAEPPVEALQGNRGSSFYREVAEALREAPGKWAILPRDYSSENSAQSAAQNIRRGKIQAMPEGQYEAVLDKSAKKIYVRYVGNGGEHADPTPGQPVDLDSYPVRVRTWAAANGIEVPSRGRISSEVIRQYEEATQDTASNGGVADGE
jgi:hypothetical protein